MTDKKDDQWPDELPEEAGERSAKPEPIGAQPRPLDDLYRRLVEKALGYMDQLADDQKARNERFEDTIPPNFPSPVERMRSIPQVAVFSSKRAAGAVDKANSFARSLEADQSRRTYCAGIGELRYFAGEFHLVVMYDVLEPARSDTDDSGERVPEVNAAAAE